MYVVYDRLLGVEFRYAERSIFKNGTTLAVNCLLKDTDRSLEPIFSKKMTQLRYAYTLLASSLVESLPFLLIGIVISSGLLAFVDEHQLAAKLPRNRVLGAIIGSSLGLVLPAGQYGNIPVTRRLLLQGVPLPVAMSFWVASPIVNPFVIWGSGRVLGDRPRILFLWLLAAWLMGMMMGLLFSTYPDKPFSAVKSSVLRSPLLRSGSVFLPPETRQPLHRAGNLIYESQTATPISLTFRQRLLLFSENLVREFLELGSILVLGCATAVTIQLFFPQAQLLEWATTPAREVLSMLILSLVLSLSPLFTPYFISSSTATFLYGSQLGFLLWSSLLNLKSIALVLASLRLKPAIYLLVLTGQLIGLLALVLNFYVS